MNENRMDLLLFIGGFIAGLATVLIGYLIYIL